MEEYETRSSSFFSRVPSRKSTHAIFSQLNVQNFYPISIKMLCDVLVRTLESWNQTIDYWPIIFLSFNFGDIIGEITPFHLYKLSWEKHMTNYSYMYYNDSWWTKSWNSWWKISVWGHEPHIHPTSKHVPVIKVKN